MTYPIEYAEYPITNKGEEMEYFKIKRRMVELDAILKVRPRDKQARQELGELKKINPLAWLEVQ